MFNWLVGLYTKTITLHGGEMWTISVEEQKRFEKTANQEVPNRISGGGGEEVETLYMEKFDQTRRRVGIVCKWERRREGLARGKIGLLRPEYTSKDRKDAIRVYYWKVTRRKVNDERNSADRRVKPRTDRTIDNGREVYACVCPCCGFFVRLVSSLFWTRSYRKNGLIKP